MSVYLFHHSLDTKLLRVKFHLLSILYSRSALFVSHICPGLARGDALNIKCTRLFSLDMRGRSLVSIFIPVLRAPGGRKERKSRAVFALGLKGLKTVFTSVMNLVIMMAQCEAIIYISY